MTATTNTMIRNYVKIALRSLVRNKFYAFINITGLGIGLACCLLISLYVKDEWTFDRFHTKSSSIYRAYVKEDYGENQQFFNTVTPFPLGPVLKENFEEVEHAVRINNLGTQVRADGEQFSESVTIADPSFFEVFDFPLIHGDKASALTDASHLIISQEAALKYFGEANVVGKTLQLQIGDTFEDFEVKGVATDPLANSSIRFSVLASSLIYPRLYNERTLNSGWFNVTPETYVLLSEGSDANALQEKFPPLFRSILGDEFQKSNYFVGLQPLTDIHLNPDFPTGNAPVSDPSYSYIMGGVAVLILFLASINFVTLSIGQTLRRAREVGVRKTVGAARRQLIGQFIGEAVLTTTLALLVAVALAGISIHLFNDLAGKSLTLKADLFTMSTAASLLILIGFLAGSYPAFVLSGFKPVAVLKGSVQGGNRQSFRKVLVSIQLILAVFLVSSALIMKGQLDFLQSKNLGFDKEQTVGIQMTVPGSGGLGKRVRSGFEKAELLKQNTARCQQCPRCVPPRTISGMVNGPKSDIRMTRKLTVTFTSTSSTLILFRQWKLNWLPEGIFPAKTQAIKETESL